MKGVCVNCAADRGHSRDLVHLGQDLLVLDDVFIGGQQHVELPAAELRNKPTAQSRGALPWWRHRDSLSSQCLGWKNKRHKNDIKKNSLPCRQF